MSSHSKRKKEPCSRCGAIVSVKLSSPDSVLCVDCRVNASQTEMPGPHLTNNQPIDLSGDKILTIVCRLCRSSLLVNENKIGTEVTCPDCHSKIIVERPDGHSDRKPGRSGSRQFRKPFDPDADVELSIEEPAERPKIAPTFGLDEMTQDLLSAPLPEVEPVSDNAPDDNPVETDGNATPLSRRERYERVQRRIISAGRKKIREQARQRKQAEAELQSSASDASTTNTKKKRRRRRLGSRSPRLRITEPAFGWMRKPQLLAGWIVVSGMLSIAYIAHADWSPLALLDRWYVKLTQSPSAWDTGLILTSAIFVTGCIYLYYLCGRSFSRNVQIESVTDDVMSTAERSTWFSTFQFAIAWLIAGLPMMYWSVFCVPVQILIVPPLLVASWVNGSIWKFVHPAGLTMISEQEPLRNRGGWRRFYEILIGAAVISCFPTAMVHYGGLLTVPGCLLLAGIMIGVAGFCGWHCRELSEQLETTS